jgi:hypothetical protein
MMAGHMSCYRAYSGTLEASSCVCRSRRQIDAQADKREKLFHDFPSDDVPVDDGSSWVNKRGSKKSWAIASALA